MRHLFSAIVAVSLVFCATSNAHLMVSEHGTLNFDDSGVYMVVSLSASSFGEADRDKNGKLSLTEFSAAKDSIILTIQDEIYMSQNEVKKQLQGTMISPQVAHHGNGTDIDQIVVMGKFTAVNHKHKLLFHNGLYGHGAEQKLTMTAKYKRLGLKQRFVLTPKQLSAKVF
ncbi:hypothetical protein A7985_01835 [Pseudoalteromonas luteoviolacea]|uniref:EF-hand domain-containing protein n=1 Tax=Pseudoalteromonas luteoviolacea TaxID=43657 RepID=A0A1C0TTS9_9GAMM|nr:hypothetical protein [Pseudoalteromonas luteoviolacea]MBQ4811245.1 hypothetical protein [Pseudoalteromonas luteoviolacea]OCQ22723.1 hypothetical protein A7985_01835 [Pseudoalteromonas luteoviolacea]